MSLSPESAKSLLALAARMRLGPVVKDLVEIWKSDVAGTERSKEGAKDKSRDPIDSQDNVLGYMESGAQKEGGGPNVFMREALNLVDFFVENYLQDEDRASLEDIDNLPVSAVGVVPEADLVGIFKHYLITRLQEADPELRARYVANERVFALMLGLSGEDSQKVRESLGFTAYKNMLKNILMYKGELFVTSSLGLEFLYS